MAHLFLSYAHRDLDRVQRIYERLTTHHALYLWFDKESIKGGDEWARAIKFGIDQSYGVIFALSQAFLDSEYIRDYEIRWALERFDHLPADRRALFILRLEVVQPPKELSHIQYLDAFDAPAENPTLENLVSRLPDPNDGGHHF